MLKRAISLPDNIAVLKSLLVEQVACNAQLQTDTASLTDKNTQLLAENQRIKFQVLLLQEKLNIALAQRYAARSERCAPDQIRLFNEAEVDADIALDEDATAVTVAAHPRKKCGRKPLPDNLPRIDVIHELPQAERYCPHDGAPLAAISAVISEQLDIIPAQIRVLRHIRKTYACDCGRCIKTAPLPPQPSPKSMASPGLLAHITVAKYQDALPLYRQEAILQRIGVDIPRATLANWMIQAGLLIQPLINLLRDRLLAYDIIQMDDDCMDAGGRATQEQLPRPRYRCSRSPARPRNPNPICGCSAAAHPANRSSSTTMIRVAAPACPNVCSRAFKARCKPTATTATTPWSRAKT